MRDPRSFEAAKVQVTWDYFARETEMHERRYLVILAASVSGALAVIASILLEKVSPILGLVLATGLLVLSLYVHLLIRRLPIRLRSGYDETLALIESFMRPGDD